MRAQDDRERVHDFEQLFRRGWGVQISLDGGATWFYGQLPYDFMCVERVEGGYRFFVVVQFAVGELDPRLQYGITAELAEDTSVIVEVLRPVGPHFHNLSPEPTPRDANPRLHDPNWVISLWRQRQQPK